MNIYYCLNCSKELESIAKANFEQDFDTIEKEYEGVRLFHLKSTYDIKYIYYIQELQCECGGIYHAVWYSRFFSESTEIEDYYLVHINGSHYFPILGLKTRAECRNLLHNLFLRWRNLANHIFWVTPFIGYKNVYINTHQFDWEWLTDHFELFKTTIITRRTTKNLIIKMFNELIKDQDGLINLEYLFNKYGFDQIANPFLTEHNIRTYQHFHAKFYAAIFPQLNKAEVIETSFNILKAGENYYENISMRDYPLDYFEKNFIEPLGFNLSEIKILPESILEYPKQKVKKTTDTNGKDLYNFHPVQAFVLVKEGGNFKRDIDYCFVSKWEFLLKYLPSIPSVNSSKFR